MILVLNKLSLNCDDCCKESARYNSAAMMLSRVRQDSGNAQEETEPNLRGP